MIDYTLYLPHYAIGNVIQFQIEDYLRDKVLGPEMERMCLAGNIMPQVWMKNAVGARNIGQAPAQGRGPRPGTGQIGTAPAGEAVTWR